MPAPEVVGGGTNPQTPKGVTVTEEELIAAAKEIAEKMKAGGAFQSVDYVDEGKLEGEPASIMVELEDGRMFALGVLPV